MVAASQGKIIADRLKNGQCIHCGIQTHEIVKNGILKQNEKIPLNNHWVQHGRCLLASCQQAGINVTVVEGHDEDYSEDRLNRISQGLSMAAQVVGLGATVGGFVAVCCGADLEVIEALMGLNTLCQVSAPTLQKQSAQQAHNYPQIQCTTPYQLTQESPAAPTAPCVDASHMAVAPAVAAPSSSWCFQCPSRHNTYFAIVHHTEMYQCDICNLYLTPGMEIYCCDQCPGTWSVCAKHR